METYSKFRPTQYDTSGLGMPDRQNWLVLPCGRNRDSDCVCESNFHTALKMLGGESDTVEVRRFGHWGCGWFEVIIVAPDSPAQKVAEKIECSLADYSILDESDLSERECEAAFETWKNCYNDSERLEYIREHRHHFEFSNLAEVAACVRGRTYRGDNDAMLGG